MSSPSETLRRVTSRYSFSGGHFSSGLNSELRPLHANLRLVFHSVGQRKPSDEANQSEENVSDSS